MSKASTLARAISTRLSEIRASNGYATDIGAHVFRGKQSLDVDTDIPGTVLVEGDDKIHSSAASANMPATVKTADTLIAQQYAAEGHMACDADNPNDVAHLILADLKKAIFAGDKTFGGLVRSLVYVGRRIGVRNDGSNTISAAVLFEAVFVENLAAP